MFENHELSMGFGEIQGFWALKERERDKQFCEFGATNVMCLCNFIALMNNVMIGTRFEYETKFVKSP